MKNYGEPPQPDRGNWLFVDELRKPEVLRCSWSRVRKAPGEADLSGGVTICAEVVDPDGMLETAYASLESFLRSCGLSVHGGGYRIVAGLVAEADDSEGFTVEIGEKECRIMGAGLEGVRRGIYYFEELLLGSDGPFLPVGSVRRFSWLKTRISRCFFGPIKRAPLNRDELMDEVDYYPDAYLERLAREGVNGLWLTIAFRDLCRTSVTPEYGIDAEKRFDKLRRTVDKCLRYGIKTYVFCIEPAAFEQDSPVLLRHPELGGAAVYSGQISFCPFSAAAQRYLYEAVNLIFRNVPRLGGMINISHGERPTTCLSSVVATEDNKIIGCPVCSGKKHGEILRAALVPMVKGMCDAAPDAQLVSWLYMPQPARRAEWVFTLPEYIPDKVVLQFNFESGGMRDQLGKSRVGGDYWLSYEGPCENFSRIAAPAAKASVPLSAKIQVGCSHEVATVPFVPVPSLLYRKYRKMMETGVTSVMQCWYFGNYPGVMNRAAGLLAFEDFSHGSETDFLLRLARPEWGGYARRVVEAWQWFAKGYALYPFSNMFQYYGPMHDGIVWPLYLEPVRKPLAPTWKLEFGTSGDCIGESLENHTLDEALTLCRKMAENWQRGVDILIPLREEFAAFPERLNDIGVAEALGIQFESGCAILDFYSMREKLINCPGDTPEKTLGEMRAIVVAETERSRRMIELCRADSRLGFHSEAEGYKYFPEKLEWRIAMLKSLLEEDFPAAFRRLSLGQSAIARPEPGRSHTCGEEMVDCGSFRWRARLNEGILRFLIECRGVGSYDSLSIALVESDISFPILMAVNFIPLEMAVPESVVAVIAEQDYGWSAEFKVPLSLFKAPGITRIGLDIRRVTAVNGKIENCSWSGDDSGKPPFRLNLGRYKPAGLGTLLLGKELRNSDCAGNLRLQPLK